LALTFFINHPPYLKVPYGTVRYEKTQKRTKTCEQTWDPEEGRSGEEKPGSGSLSSNSLGLLRGLHSLIHHQHWLSVVLKQNGMIIRGKEQEED
jgi:hypothetical protein